MAANVAFEPSGHAPELVGITEGESLHACVSHVKVMHRLRRLATSTSLMLLAALQLMLGSFDDAFVGDDEATICTVRRSCIVHA